PQVRWNTNGTALAVSGLARLPATHKTPHMREASVVKFYSPYGVLLRFLKV
ncbi:unnamed protein product, partial [Discosporangium mesarthrocarpum]